MATNDFYRDRRQLRIAERLFRLVGPGPAAFFRDACRHLTGQSGFEATSHQVGHLIREIESAIRAVLKVVAPSASDKKSANEHEKTIRLILEALEMEPDGLVAKAWLRYAPGDDGLHSRAHRDSLSAPRPVDDEFKTFWEDMQGIFDEILARFEKHFLVVYRTIDAVTTKDIPTAADLSFLRNNIPNNFVARQYFFSRLTKPAWLQPLADAGFFIDVPGAERDEVAQTITFPRWPAGRYLAEMAKQPDLHQAVLDVSLKVRDTDNAQVHEVLADVALALPAALARLLVPKAKEFFAYHDFGIVYMKVAELVALLARGGEPAAAIELASELFAILPGKAGRPALRHDVRGRMDEHQYLRLLEQCRPALSEAAGKDAIDLFCSLLDTALRQSDGASKKADYSWIWRPSIKDHPQNGHDGIQGALVSAIRDCTRDVVARDASQLTALVDALEARRRVVYQRLALDLLAQAPEHHLGLVEARLLDGARFKDGGQRHEFSVLAARAFPYLSDEVRSKYLSRIDAADEVDSSVARSTREHGVAPPPAEIESRRRSWQRDRLAPLKEVLPTEWRVRYDDLVAAEGEPDHPEFPSHSRSWSGPTSPVTSAELAAMPIDQLVEHLRSWKAPSERMSPTPEGLGRQLVVAVAADPSRFANAARSFAGLDSTYVRSVLRGLQDGLKAGRAFDWQPVLSLAGWVVAQHRSASDADLPERDRDPHWGWARKAIADLLQSGFDSPADPIPFESRETVWSILAQLAEDPDPRPEDETKYGGSNMDPGTMSLNTTRGEAMHAVVDYALWVRRHRPRELRDFSDMPEVQVVFDRHLDRSHDPSTTTRAVFGWRLPNLCYLDSSWVATRLLDLFPSTAADAMLREAAWETYLGFNSPGDATWPLLEGQYRRAVEELQEGRKGPVRKSLNGDPIVQHIMTLYWHGQQGLDDGSLVTRFFEVASEDLRHEALDFIGRHLGGTDAIEEEVILRMKTLWRERLAAGTRAPGSHAKELSSFAWWVKADRLDLDWRLAQLLEVLKAVGPVDPAFIVVEVLAEAAATHPKEAVACLAAMIDVESNEWEPTMWSKEARGLLELALASNDAEAVRAARELVNVLAARGYDGYRDLLAA